MKKKKTYNHQTVCYVMKIMMKMLNMMEII